MSLRIGSLLIAALLLCGASIARAAGAGEFTGTIQHVDRTANSFGLVGGEGDEQTLTVYVDTNTRFQWAQGDGGASAPMAGAISFGDLALGDSVAVKYITTDGRHVAEHVSKQAR